MTGGLVLTSSRGGVWIKEVDRITLGVLVVDWMEVKVRYRKVGKRTLDLLALMAALAGA